MLSRAAFWADDIAGKAVAMVDAGREGFEACISASEGRRKDDGTPPPWLSLPIHGGKGCSRSVCMEEG